MRTRTFSVAAGQLHNFTGILEDNELENRIVGLYEEDEESEVLFEVDYEPGDSEVILYLIDEYGEFEDDEEEAEE